MKGNFDMQGLMKKAQDMQRQMAHAQDDLKERIVEGSSGGGLVVAHANGARAIVGVKIDPKAVDPSDPSMLEDLIIAACNQALEKAHKMYESEMQKITGGMNIPGLFG
ncbi:MAG: YbaB/EbfC family nucleoid-associated protein [Candidatus Brocadiae bacterium]|nr:YbaB/EbfC family nucleoid-associated protein [Candidatus Brocadiia bacterium]